MTTMNLQRAAARMAAWLALALGAALLTGCATVAHPDPRDPLESYNRSMTNFNEHVDSMVLKPVAIAYKDAVPFAMIVLLFLVRPNGLFGRARVERV